eukprot:jgi/Mesvir1/20128/Mv13367-RA.1
MANLILSLDELKRLLDTVLRLTPQAQGATVSPEDVLREGLKAYVHSISLGVQPHTQSTEGESVACVCGMSKVLPREEVVRLATRLRPYLPLHSLETATKTDLCALIADDIVDNLTRILCAVNLVHNGGENANLADAASVLSGCPVERILRSSRTSMCMIIAASLTPGHRAASLLLGDAPGIFVSVPWKSLGEAAATLTGGQTSPDPCVDGILSTLVLISRLMEVRGEDKSRLLRDNLPLVVRAALSPPRVWNSLLAMTTGKVEADPLIDKALRGMSSAASPERSRGGKLALSFYAENMGPLSQKEGEIVNECRKGRCDPPPCLNAWLRLQRVRADFAKTFLRKRRSRVYA